MNEALVLPSNHISLNVKHTGKRGMAERLSCWIGEIVKLDPENKTTDDVVQFLMILRNEVAEGKFDEQK